VVVLSFTIPWRVYRCCCFFCGFSFVVYSGSVWDLFDRVSWLVCAVVGFCSVYVVSSADVVWFEVTFIALMFCSLYLSFDINEKWIVHAIAIFWCQ